MHLEEKGLPAHRAVPEVLKEVEPIHIVDRVRREQDVHLLLMAVAEADLHDFGAIRTAGVATVPANWKGVSLALGADIGRIDVGFS